MPDDNVFPIKPTRDLDSLVGEIKGIIHLVESQFARVGQLLTEIKDNDLWVPYYETWEQFIEAEFNRDARWSRRMRQSYRAIVEIENSPLGNVSEVNEKFDKTEPVSAIPATIPEAHARELVKVPAEQREQVYVQAETQARGEGKKVTAAAIQQASRGGTAPAPKKTPLERVAAAVATLQDRSDGAPLSSPTIDWVIEALTALRAGEPPVAVPEFITKDKPFIYILIEQNAAWISGSYGVREAIVTVGGNPIWSSTARRWTCSPKTARDLLAYVDHGDWQVKVDEVL